MILKFEDRGYIDMSEVVAMRWQPSVHRGVIVFNGERIVVNKTEYDKIEQGYLWLHKTHIHEDNKKYLLVQREKGE